MNWCANLSLEQCASTSTLQTTVNITDIVEAPEIEIPKSEIISSEMMPQDFGREGMVEMVLSDSVLTENISSETPEEVNTPPIAQEILPSEETDVSSEKHEEPDALPLSLDDQIIKEESNETLLQ